MQYGFAAALCGDRKVSVPPYGIAAPYGPAISLYATPTGHALPAGRHLCLHRPTRSTVCIYVYVCMCMYVYVCVCMYVCKCMNVCSYYVDT